LKTRHNTLLALAITSMAGTAMAQSSVTLYGLLDIGVSHAKGSGAGSTSSTRISSGNTQGSRFGLRGVEDLGSGYSTGFNLESGISVDTGEMGPTNTNNQSTGTTPGLWGRRSTISFFAPWGEVRAGRDFSTQYRNRVEVDPFGSAGIGAIQPFVGSLGGVVSTRVSNMVGYYLPSKLGGLYGQAQIYLGENASGLPNSKSGNGRNIRLGYAQGNLNVSVSAATTDYLATASAGDTASQSIALQYRIGEFNLMTGVYRDAVERTTSTLVGRGWTLGGIWSFGSENIKVALSKYGQNLGAEPSTSKLSLGWEHRLSKRTTLYTDFAQVKNTGGATTALGGAVTAPNASSTGVDFGLKHTF